MNGQDNLIPLNKRSKEIQRQIQEKGRKANKEKWEQKKKLKDELEILMEQVSKDGRTYQELISTALVKEALKGNTKAYEIIRDTMGQKPIEQKVVNATINDPFDELSVEELKKLANEN